MMQTTRDGKWGAMLLAVLCMGATAYAAVSQWDLNGDLASTTGGEPLVPGFAAPATAAGVTFETATIGGEPAQAVHFTRGTFLRLTHGFDPNGGGLYVNRYSLIMDVMFPNRPKDFTSLLQTNLENSNDGEWFIHTNGGIGISGVYGGMVESDVWYRLALVVDLAAGTMTYFINGAQVNQLTGQGLDSRFSLDPAALLFADNDQENAEGLLNSVQIRNFPMSADEIAELGGPSAAGIPAEIDECAVSNPADDCNGNNVKDYCDIRDGTSGDCNANGIPDECDIASGASEDCNGNGVPDECELAGRDCNQNGILDACEILDGTVPDCDLNGIPDTCQAGAAVSWQFDGSLAGSAGAADIVPGAAAPAAEPGVTFETATIGGADAQVAHFTRGTFLELTHGFAANGGGAYLNQYTLIMDVQFLADRSGYTSLLQTATANDNDGDWFIDGDGGLGISSNYAGVLTGGEWHRVALVVDAPLNAHRSYLNGARVTNNSGGPVDGRFSLDAQALLFADNDSENSEGFINSVQVRAYAMTDAEIAALGTATAAGIPDPDCDRNGVPDACELEAGDCNQNGVLDACELEGNDCNANGVLDACELEGNDCNGNGIPDDCELAGNDCNGNGVPDSCDIAQGTSTDNDADGIPDECAGVAFRRGDPNQDGKTDIADAVAILGHLFAQGHLDCVKTADANDSNAVDIADAIYVLGYLFAQGPAPKAPFETCGIDPTPDVITCESFKSSACD